jgi:hypothetical protein
MAISGKIGNWEIQTGGIFNDTDDAYIIQRHQFPDGKEAAVYIGTSILPATTGLRAVAMFINQEPNTIASGGIGTNHCAIFEASGADVNFALEVAQGDINLNSANIITEGKQALTRERLYTANGTNYILEITNGLITGTRLE